MGAVERASQHRNRILVRKQRVPILAERSPLQLDDVVEHQPRAPQSAGRLLESVPSAGLPFSPRPNRLVPQRVASSALSNRGP